MLKTRVACSTAVVVLLFTSCATQRKNATPEIERVSENPTFRIRATTAGDVSGTVSGDSEVSFVRRRTEDGNPDRSIVAWAAVQPVTGAGGSARFVLTVSPFADDGTYAVGSGIPGGSGDQGGGSSTVQVFWWPPGTSGAGSAVLFEHRVEACTVDIGRLGHEGMLRCPQLASRDGKRASLELEWHKV